MMAFGADQTGGQVSLDLAPLHLAALSPNSRRAYAAQWAQWVAYAADADLPVLPAAPGDVARWLLSRSEFSRKTTVSDSRRLARRPSDSVRATGLTRARQSTEVSSVVRPDTAVGVTVSTLKTAICAVRTAHLAHGHSFESRHPDLVLALRAAHQGDSRHASKPRQALPLRVAMLSEIINSLTDSAGDCRDAALLALGDCFARRRSEIVGLDFERPGTGTGVLKMTRTALEVHLYASKCGARDREVYVVPRASNRRAVTAILRWVSLAGVQAGEPILRRVYRSGRICSGRLSAQSVALIVKARVAQHLERLGQPSARANAEAEHYAGHSLRVGFAVTAAEAGATVLAIQKSLGHAQPVMAARYAQAAEQARLSPHLLPGVSLAEGPFQVRRKRRRQVHGR